MKASYLTTLLGIAIIAVPAAVPASQPASRSIETAPAATTAVPVVPSMPIYLDPHQPVELEIVYPVGFTTLEEINRDPFAG